ncbi:hypothetical protein H4582DRAFT_110660 [Lactarius indigo]|nr:hypothetical protein H4582DRAFT_110660 [Lactarius indigo]
MIPKPKPTSTCTHCHCGHVCAMLPPLTMQPFRIVVDWTIHAPVPADTLAQPGTDHPYQRARSLSCIHQICRGPLPLGRLVHCRVSSLANARDAHDLHDPRRGAAPGERSRVQRHIAVYKQCCVCMGDSWECGIHRVDWFGSKFGYRRDRQEQ